MRTNMRSAIIIITLALLTACGGGAGTDKVPSADTTGVAVEGAKRIRTMEDTLFAKSVFDRKGAQALLDVYMAFAKNYPLDTMAPEYIFRAASLTRTLGDPQAGIDLYDRIIKDYPSWRRLVDTYYLKAFTLDNDLQLKGAAKTAYEEVITRFPDHKFAADSKQMIENLQYTDAELIERFKKMNPPAGQAGASASADSGKGR